MRRATAPAVRQQRYWPGQKPSDASSENSESETSDSSKSQAAQQAKCSKPPPLPPPAAAPSAAHAEAAKADARDCGASGRLQHRGRHDADEKATRAGSSKASSHSREETDGVSSLSKRHPPNSREKRDESRKQVSRDSSSEERISSGSESNSGSHGVSAESDTSSRTDEGGDAFYDELWSAESRFVPREQRTLPRQNESLEAHEETGGEVSRDVLEKRRMEIKSALLEESVLHSSQGSKRDAERLLLERRRLLDDEDRESEYELDRAKWVQRELARIRHHARASKLNCASGNAESDSSEQRTARCVGEERAAITSSGQPHAAEHASLLKTGKNYHKGAFFMDAADPILQRDYSVPTERERELAACLQQNPDLTHHLFTDPTRAGRRGQPKGSHSHGCKKQSFP